MSDIWFKCSSFNFFPERFCVNKVPFFINGNWFKFSVCPSPFLNCKRKVLMPALKQDNCVFIFYVLCGDGKYFLSFMETSNVATCKVVLSGFTVWICLNLSEYVWLHCSQKTLLEFNFSVGPYQLNSISAQFHFIVFWGGSIW